MFIHAISEFWLPILVSSVAIWLVSSLLWAVLPWHRKDHQKLNNQIEVQQVLANSKAIPGLYTLPFAPTAKEMDEPETKAMLEKGPLALITILPADVFNMGKRLGLWFLQNLLIASIIAFLIEIVLLGVADNDARRSGIIFHVAALMTLLAYGGAYLTEGIWFSRTWKVVAKYLVDALIYAVITGVAFVYLS